jgi:hypothetical protein
MQSANYQILARRIGVLKRQYLPPIKNNGLYSSAQQDQMRALRLLAHAEIENYLEESSLQLLTDLEQELRSPRAGRPTERIWAERVVTLQRAAITNNNGVTAASILSLFANFGLTKEVLDKASPLLLDRMSDFGRQRGDVAHQSALKAKLLLNRIREEKFIDEILGHCKKLDSIICGIRINRFLS